MSLGDAGDDCINVLSRVTTVLNTDLESVTTELDETQDKLLEAHARIRQLEAQLAGRAPHLLRRTCLLSPPCHRLARSFAMATRLVFYRC